MAIEYGSSKAVFSEDVGIDAAEDLLQWLQRTPSAEVDLSSCDYLHPANVQILLASRAILTALPRPPGWRMWLESILRPALGQA